MKVFDLSAVLRLDKTEYEKGLSNAASAAKLFSSKVAGFMKAGISAFTSVATAAVNVGKTLVQNTGQVAAYGDNIDKMSQKMGFSRSVSGMGCCYAALRNVNGNAKSVNENAFAGGRKRE